LACSSSPAISTVGWRSLKLGVYEVRTADRIDGVDHLGAEQGPLDAFSERVVAADLSLGGKPPEKSNGLVASITTQLVAATAGHSPSPLLSWVRVGIYMAMIGNRRSARGVNVGRSALQIDSRTQLRTSLPVSP
jgi:hypothetical protein